MKKIVFWGFVLQIYFISQAKLDAQAGQRPAIWGIAKMTILVSDFSLARDYYGRFLGFGEAFTYQGNMGKVISFKVNDRQFLEFIEDSHAKEKNRLISVSFETDYVGQMLEYLRLKGLKVPDKTTFDGAGNEVFTVVDPSGNHIEFISFNPNGLHKKSKGKYLSERRISKRIHHVGLYAEKISDNDPFYTGMLNFKELVRYPEDRNVAPTILYLGMDDCIENIEHYFPNDRNVSHPCFLVDDMQETIYTLRERKVNETFAKPMIGKGRRWILNLYNSDSTRVEFTEAHTVR